MPPQKVSNKDCREINSQKISLDNFFRVAQLEHPFSPGIFPFTVPCTLTDHTFHNIGGTQILESNLLRILIRTNLLKIHFFVRST